VLTELVINGLNDLAGATGYIFLGVAVLYTVFSVTRYVFGRKTEK
jgi:hypothetical protein